MANKALTVALLRQTETLREAQLPGGRPAGHQWVIWDRLLTLVSENAQLTP